MIRRSPLSRYTSTSNASNVSSPSSSLSLSSGGGWMEGECVLTECVERGS